MTIQPLTIENLTEEQKQRISEGLKLYIQKELETMTESCPNSYRPEALYLLDSLMSIATKRGYIDNIFSGEYSKTRNELMERYSQSEN